MANPLRAEATFKVEGETYRLKFDWNAAAVFEDRTGKPLSDVLLDIARKKVVASDLRAMLWAGLRLDHADVSLEEAGHLMAHLGRVETQRLMGIAMRFFYPELPGGDSAPGGEEAGSAGANPPGAAAR